MRFFRVQNARQSIAAGGQVLAPDPLFVEAGSWVGVLSTPDKVGESLSGDARINEISEADFNGLKKNGTPFGIKSRVLEKPVIPTIKESAEVAEEEKPDTVEEVLIEGKADPPDSLSDDKPTKRTRRKKK
jgi:hypothetical protein